MVYLKSLLIAMSILFTQSCHSVVAYGFGAEKPFAGTQLVFTDFETETNPMSFGEKTGLTIFKLIDFPFSLVSDCILYPVTRFESFLDAPKEKHSCSKCTEKKKDDS